jgi:hypothetical protein
LVGQKLKGMPLIFISLTKLVDSAASEAMANLSLELFKAFKNMRFLLREGCVLYPCAELLLHYCPLSKLLSFYGSSHCHVHNILFNYFFFVDSFISYKQHLVVVLTHLREVDLKKHI